ncbi:hypothetical protein MKX03_032773 [Papaver bracteatum]|nr:hypothetical protein MKX03_032773 [Papaver bracteatum]
MLRFLSLNHLLMLSMALNISFLLSRLLDESVSLRFKIHEDEKSQERGGNPYRLVWGTGDNTSPAALAEDIIELKKVIQPDYVIIDLGHGDPTMYEQFWKKTGKITTILIPGWQCLSYYSDISKYVVCWFLEPNFAGEVRRLHKLVVNANTDNRKNVVGTGSNAPFYSAYPLMTDFQKSGLYKWVGDAYTFNGEDPYIEVVNSPNNPDGLTRKPVVNVTGCMLLHGLAYYWPQYTPIASQLDQEIMLFTVSQSTGHAGTRIGWALVKDIDIAQKMTEFIELNTTGVSRDSQLRAEKILAAVSDSCTESAKSEIFFEFSRRLMIQRWKQLRDAVRTSGLFSLPEHHKVITRSGKHFGRVIRFVRVSMLGRDDKLT